MRRTQRSRAGQWRIKDNPRRANRAGAGTDKVMCHLMFGVLNYGPQLNTSLRNGIIQAAPRTRFARMGAGENAGGFTLK